MLLFYSMRYVPAKNDFRDEPRKLVRIEGEAPRDVRIRTVSAGKGTSRRCKRCDRNTFQPECHAHGEMGEKCLPGVRTGGENGGIADPEASRRSGASMSLHGPYLCFPSFGELLHYFEEHTGTITRALIPPTNAAALKVSDQPASALREAGLVLELASGETAYLNSADAEAVLNDGILNRQHIEITFMG
jgi:hypothetical protein